MRWYIFILTLLFVNSCSKEPATVSFNCDGSTCVEVEGLAGTYTTKQACEANCIGPATNADWQNAISLICGQRVQGTTFGEGKFIECDNWQFSGPGLWYRFVGQGTDAIISTCDPGTNFDTQIAVFKGICSDFNCEVGNDDSNTGCSVSSNASELRFYAEQGVNYLIYVSGYDNGELGDFVLSIECVNPVGGYDCVNGDCIYVERNPNYSTLVDCQSRCSGPYPQGSVFCSSGPTAIVEVVSPITGRIWMDRNLGASRAAICVDDVSAFGDFYQWGRFSDGHQCRSTSAISQVSNSDRPSHGNFIIALSEPYDWRFPQNSTLWQGVDGINNPCPKGFRIPTSEEFDAEIKSRYRGELYDSFLKLPAAGMRKNDGTEDLHFPYYWTSSAVLDIVIIFPFDAANRASGLCVRCIKD